MQTVQNSPYSFDCFSSGVDWITATAGSGGSRSAFEEVGQHILQTETAAGVEVEPAAVRDYSGWRVPGVFVGTRRDDSIIVLSGAGALAHWQRVAQASTNVSRLDLQATLWTHGEQPALSRWYYQRVRRQSAKRGRPRTYSLIQTHPHGDTLYVGKRTSDCFGRVYDYAAAHKKGEPRTVWRFEVEYKRQMARSHSRALLALADPHLATESLVHSWFEARGIQPAWVLSRCPRSEVLSDSGSERDALAWFRNSLQKTVAREVRRHGLAVVLDALGLSAYVMPKTRKERDAYASQPRPTLPGNHHRRIARSVDADATSFQERAQRDGFKRHG